MDLGQHLHLVTGAWTPGILWQDSTLYASKHSARYKAAQLGDCLLSRNVQEWSPIGGYNYGAGYLQQISTTERLTMITIV